MSANNERSYRVSTFRNAGLEARWGKTRNGTPAIFAREPGQKVWYMVTDSMWQSMGRDGVLEGFRNATLLGDIFSIPA